MIEKKFQGNILDLALKLCLGLETHQSCNLYLEYSVTYKGAVIESVYVAIPY